MNLSNGRQLESVWVGLTILRFCACTARRGFDLASNLDGYTVVILICVLFAHFYLTILFIFVVSNHQSTRI